MKRTIISFYRTFGNNSTPTFWE